MLEDLCSQMKLWKDAGDQLVLIFDASEDVTLAKLTVTIRTLGLTEATTNKHAALGIVPTYNRDSKPIDSIFMSLTLN